MRSEINDYEEVLPVIIEIPGKDSPYDPKKDTVIIKAHKLLYGADAV